MNILTFTGTDKFQLITSSAATLKVLAVWADLASNGSGDPVMGRTPTAIASATTTDIVATPASGWVRNIKELIVYNADGTLSVDVTPQYNANATPYPLSKWTLAPGEALEYIEGIGWFPMREQVTPILPNASITSQTGFASDTYLVGSDVLFTRAPVAKAAYECTFDLTKTAAGTAAPTFILRFGTAGSVADTARVTFTGPAQSAVADLGRVWIRATFRTVGSGTSAVLQGICYLEHNLAVTGLATNNPAGMVPLFVTSSGFDSSVADSRLGLSVNGGASASWTVQQVHAEMIGM